MEDFFHSLSVGQVVQDYDTDKMIAAYGFGAHIENPQLNKHCFPLTLNSGNPMVHGVQGLLQAYKNCIQTTQLSGPTYFKDVLRT